MRVTGSKSNLLAECQWFARPEAEWVYTSSAAAERGTAFHTLIANYIATGIAPTGMTDDLGALFAAAKKWVDDYGRDHLRPEVKFAWDPATDTARELTGAERDYAEARGGFAATGDLLAISKATRTGYLGDWKTGDGSGATAQLRALGLMLARTHDLDTVTVEALEVTAAGVVSVCRETLDAFALATIAGELAEYIAAIPSAEPTPGAHCSEMYCPARTTCPVTRAATAELVPVDALVRHTMTAVVASADHAAWMLDRIRLVEGACKSIRDAIKEACPPKGWTLEDGSVLREGTRDVPRFDKAKALDLARAKGATEAEIAACTYVFTESSGLRLSKPAKEKKRGKAA